MPSVKLNILQRLQNRQLLILLRAPNDTSIHRHRKCHQAGESGKEGMSDLEGLPVICKLHVIG